MNKLLSIQDRVGAWGQSFVPPSPSYRGLITCGLGVVCHSALLLSSERTSKPFSLLGRIFLCSQCVESALDKLILYTSYVTLFITIKPAMGVSHSLFHPYGICVFTTQ